MNRTVPVIYVIFLTTFAVCAAVFTTLFCVGLSGSEFIIPPFLNAVLCSASVGMTSVGIAAIVEWIRKSS